MVVNIFNAVEPYIYREPTGENSIVYWHISDDVDSLWFINCAMFLDSVHHFI